MAESQSKPLSEKPLGYLLAAAGGLLGGPIGVILSLVVIFVLGNILKPKDGKTPNRFLVWAAIGIIGAPLSIAPFLGSSTNTQSSGSASGTTSASNTANSTSIIPLGVQDQVRADRALSVTGSETFSSISSSNQFMEPISAKGGQLVGVFMTIKNTGNESGNMFWTTFQLEDSQGRKYDDIEDFTEIVTLGAWAKERGLAEAGDQLFPGAVAKTVAVFRVAPDAQGLRLVVNGDKYFAIN